MRRTFVWSTIWSLVIIAGLYGLLQVLAKLAINPFTMWSFEFVITVCLTMVLRDWKEEKGGEKIANTYDFLYGFSMAITIALIPYILLVRTHAYPRIGWTLVAVITIYNLLVLWANISIDSKPRKPSPNAGIEN